MTHATMAQDPQEVFNGKIKFSKNPEDEQLLAVFRTRVALFFESRNLSRKANLEVKLKTVLLLTVFFGTYLSMLLGGFGPIGSFLLALMCGVSLVMIVYNISHDASHNSLFKSKRINRALSLTFNMAGGSAYMWHITHDEIHHTYANVAGIDADLEQALPYLRIMDEVPFRWYHRYQGIYVWFIYSIYTLYLVFIKDLEDYRILPKPGSPLMKKQHSFRELAILLISKLIYLTYALVLPLIFLPFHWLGIVAGYIGVTIVMSLPLVLIQVPLHVNREARFTKIDRDGTIQKSWLTNTLENTSDYGSTNRLLNFLFGGINSHIVHHLCPGVCHVHYTALSRILKQTLLEFGRMHIDTSLWSAIRSHILHIHDLSKPPTLKNL